MICFDCTTSPSPCSIHQPNGKWYGSNLIIRYSLSFYTGMWYTGHTGLYKFISSRNQFFDFDSERARRGRLTAAFTRVIPYPGGEDASRPGGIPPHRDIRGGASRGKAFLQRSGGRAELPSELHEPGGFADRGRVPARIHPTGQAAAGKAAFVRDGSARCRDRPIPGFLRRKPFHPDFHLPGRRHAPDLPKYVETALARHAASETARNSPSEAG